MPDQATTNFSGPISIAYGCRWYSDVALSSFDAEANETSESSPDAASPLPILVQHRVSEPPRRSLVQEGRHLLRCEDGLRYVTDDGQTYDTFRGERILISGPLSSQDLPLPFYGTVVSVLLAWRGLIPIHGSAIAWNGRALLLCGPAGAGKSTLAAALIARGATLISDDLSLLHCVRPDQPLRIFPGRTSLRLFPSTAAALGESVPWLQAPRPADHKLAVFPPRADSWNSLPLHGLILPGEQHSRPDAAGVLANQLFRPKAMHAIPGQRWRLSTLAFAAPALTLLPFTSGPVRTPADFNRAADRLVLALAAAGL